MDRSIIAVGMVVACALAGGCDPKPPEDKAVKPAVTVRPTPVRKPGLWKQTMLIEPGDVMQSATLCLDKAAEAQLAWWSQGGVRADCARNDISRRADGTWAFQSVCELADGVKTTTVGSASGDFQSRYQTRSEVTTINSPVAALSGTRTVVIDGEWLGPCPAGMAPGDLELPSGQRVNLLQLGGAPT